MSIIFGICKPGRATVTEEELLQLSKVTERFAPDGVAVKASGRIGMGLQPYYTHARSILDSSPLADDLGNVIGFDGRLDNHHELAVELDLDPVHTPDSQIVLAAFVQWGERCFSRLLGDWAIALWSTRNQTLYLARDHAGTRTLYFHCGAGCVRWSTYLDTLVSGTTGMHLDEDFAACYLACRPIRDLTPYKNLRAILPAHYVVIHDDEVHCRAHWDSAAQARLTYRSDREYEEHFFALLKQSVERRTGPGAPILAELSGGMDSTSIVCMSDHIRKSAGPDVEILDTISFYDDSEPSLNDKPYFTAVEEHRGKVGVHIDTSFSHRTFEPPLAGNGVYLLPGADSSTILSESRFHDLVARHNYRVVLSGIGGDELAGGVPIPIPELADYLLSGRLMHLLKTSLDWCLRDRNPLVLSVLQTLKYAVALYLNPQSNLPHPPVWLSDRLRRRVETLGSRDVAVQSRFRIRPTSIDNSISWWSIMESLPHLFPALMSRLEYRYPLLDRDLVQFLFSIPREQLFLPGRKRSLMRRALGNIVPIVVLERRRKAYQLRRPLLTMQFAGARLSELFEKSRLVGAGFIKRDTLDEQLQKMLRSGDPEWWRALLRATDLELWLNSNAPRMQSRRALCADDQSSARVIVGI